MTDDRQRILIVDDDPGIVELLSELLESAEFTVSTAHDGGEALTSCTTEPPDIILLDIMLPFVDGFTVCRILRADPRFDGVPILMTTALTNTEDVERGLGAGADDYVTKPYDLRDLQARIVSAFRVRSLVRESQRQRVTTKSLTEELISSQERLRTQMAAELHDGVIQTLVATRMWLESAAEDESLPPDLRWNARDLAVSVDEALDSGRGLLRDLRPHASKIEQLGDAIREQIEGVTCDAGLDVDFAVSGNFEMLSVDLRDTVYQMVRESLVNVVQHAGAHHVTVRLDRQEGVVKAEVTDDGGGFDVATLDDLDDHFGLSSLRERANLLGGTAEVESAPGQGTCVRIVLPLTSGR